MLCPSQAHPSEGDDPSRPDPGATPDARCWAAGEADVTMEDASTPGIDHVLDVTMEDAPAPDADINPLDLLERVLASLSVTAQTRARPAHDALVEALLAEQGDGAELAAWKIEAAAKFRAFWREAAWTADAVSMSAFCASLKGELPQLDAVTKSPGKFRDTLLAFKKARAERESLSLSVSQASDRQDCVLNAAGGGGGALGKLAAARAKRQQSQPTLAKTASTSFLASVSEPSPLEKKLASQVQECFNDVVKLDPRAARDLLPQLPSELLTVLGSQIGSQAAIGWARFFPRVSIEDAVHTEAASTQATQPEDDGSIETVPRDRCAAALELVENLQGLCAGPLVSHQCLAVQQHLADLAALHFPLAQAWHECKKSLNLDALHFIKPPEASLFGNPSALAARWGSVGRAVALGATLGLEQYNRVNFRFSADQVRTHAAAWAEAVASGADAHGSAFSAQLLPLLVNLLKRGESWASFLGVARDAVKERLALGGRRQDPKEDAGLPLLEGCLELLSAKSLFWALFSQADGEVQFRLLQDFQENLPLLAHGVTHGRPALNPALYYVLPESGQTSVLSFAVGRKASEPVGKSQMLNELFLCRFDRQAARLAFGTTDVDLGSLFHPPRDLMLADHHGEMDVCAGGQGELLRSLFQHWLVHVHRSDLDEGAHLHSLVSSLELAAETPLSLTLLVRDADGRQREALRVFPDKPDPAMPPALLGLLRVCSQRGVGLQVLSLHRLDCLPEREREQLLQYGLQRKLMDQWSGHEEAKTGILSRESFLRTLRKDPCLHTQLDELQEIGGLVDSFMSEVEIYKEDFWSEDVLSTRGRMREIREQEKRCLDASLMPAEVEQAKMRIAALRQELGAVCRPSQLAQNFSKILAHNNSCLVLSLISARLKTFNMRNITADMQHRKEAQDRLAEKERQADAVAVAEARGAIHRLSLAIERKQFSVEMAWRDFLILKEARIAAALSASPKPALPEDPFSRVDACQALLGFLDRGEPFEVVDGDTLSFSCETLKDVFAQLDQAKVLVISVLGPQSSGKSTLLNFAFGCKFSTAKGRCTKGVYGSLVKLSPSQSSVYNKLLILDTEGLQSPEKEDHEFDRKICLFCFAVSRLVLVNVAKEIHDGMKRLLEVCLFALDELQKAKMDPPEPFLVCNQNSGDSADKAVFLDQIQSVSKNVRSAGSSPEAVQAFQLSSERVGVLPTAFSTKCLQTDSKRGLRRDWVLQSVDSRFASEVAEFTRTLLARANGSSTNSNSSASLWIDMAREVWRTITLYPDLCQFASVKLCQQHKELTAVFERLDEKYLTGPDCLDRMQAHKAELLERVAKPGRLLVAAHYANMQAELKSGLHEFVEKTCQQPLLQELQNHGRAKRVEQALVDTKLGSARQRVAAHLCGHQNELLQQLSEMHAEKSRQHGIKFLDQRIAELVPDAEWLKGRPTPKARKAFLLEEFNRVWLLVPEELKKSVDLNEQSEREFQNLKEAYKHLAQLHSALGSDAQTEVELKTAVLKDDPPGACEHHLLQLLDSGRRHYLVPVQATMGGLLDRGVEAAKEIHRLEHNGEALVNLAGLVKPCAKVWKVRPLGELKKDVNWELIFAELLGIIKDNEDSFLSGFIGTNAQTRCNLASEFLCACLAPYQLDFSKAFHDEVRQAMSKQGLSDQQESVRVAVSKARDATKPIVKSGKTVNINPGRSSPYLSKHDLCNISHHPVRAPKFLVPENTDSIVWDVSGTVKASPADKCLVEALASLIPDHLKHSSLRDFTAVAPQQRARDLQPLLLGAQRQFWARSFSELRTLVDSALELGPPRSAKSGDHNTRGDRTDRSGKAGEEQQQLRRFSASLVKLVHRKVQEFLENRARPALARLGVDLDMDGCMLMHSYTVLFLWRRFREQAGRRTERSLRALEEERPKWCRHFMETILADPVGKSEATAHRMAEEIVKGLKAALRMEASQRARRRVREREREFAAGVLQAELDERLLFDRKAETVDVLAYVTDQGTVVEKEFLRRWNELADAVTKESAADYHRLAKQALRLYEHHLVKALKFAEERREQGTGGYAGIFDASAFLTGSAVFEKESDERSAAHFQIFWDLGSLPPAEITTSDATGQALWMRQGKTEEWRITDVPKDFETTPFLGLAHGHTPVPQGRMDLPRLLMGSVGKACESFGAPQRLIPDLEAFLRKLREEVREAMGGLEEALRVDLEELRMEFQCAAVGCTKTCPCCGRKCDRKRAAGPHKCACELGHQLRCMAGIAHEGGQPSFLTCDELADTHCIKELASGQWSTWAEVKKKYPDWEFELHDSTSEKLEKIRKHRSSWENHGQAICKYWRGKGICMKYTEVKGRDTHIVMVISSKVQDREAGLKEVRELISENPEACEQHCTIVFSDNEKQQIVVKEKIVAHLLADSHNSIKLDRADEWDKDASAADLIKTRDRSYYRQTLYLINAPQWPKEELVRMSTVRKELSYVAFFNAYKQVESASQQFEERFIDPYGIHCAMEDHPGMDPTEYIERYFGPYFSQAISKAAEQLDDRKEEERVRGALGGEDAGAPRELTEHGEAARVKQPYMEQVLRTHRERREGWQYEVLGLQPGATLPDAEKALKKLRIRYHSDKVPAGLRKLADDVVKICVEAKEHFAQGQS